MALLPPVEATRNPYFVRAEPVEMIPSGPGGDPPTPSNRIVGGSILDTYSFRFFIAIDQNSLPDDDDNGSNPTYTLLTFEVVPGTPHHGLDVNGKTYSGKYVSSIFPDVSITYLTDTYEQVTVRNWQEVPPKDDPNFFSVQNFVPTSMASVLMTYEAIITVRSSNSPTIITSKFGFTHLITNDWTEGRDNIVEYTS